MKNFIRVVALLLVMCGPGMSTVVFAQDSTKDSKLIGDCHTSKAAFVKVDSLMHSLFDNAAGYVIFPNVGKGGIGVGGAAGNGIMVFTQGKGGLMYEASIGGQKFSYKAY